MAAALASANISVAQFTTDDIGLIWLEQQNQTTATINTLRSLAANQSYGIQAVNTAGYYGDLPCQAFWSEAAECPPRKQLCGELVEFQKCCLGDIAWGGPWPSISMVPGSQIVTALYKCHAVVLLSSACVHPYTQQDPAWLAAHLTISRCSLMSAVPMQLAVSSAGLNSNVAGRTPDVVIVPLPGVVYSSPTAKLKKVSEHGGLMKVGSASGRQVT